MKLLIVGTGYVGLVTGVGLATLGHRVVCVDRDPARVAAIERAEAPIYEPGLPDLLQKVRASGLLTSTTDMASAVADADIVMIAVGTPLGSEGIDLSYVLAAAAEVAPLLADGRFRVVIVKSTVVPGSTDGPVRTTLETHSGLSAGRDFGLGANPEFLRESSAIQDFLEPDRIVIGADSAKSEAMIAALYSAFSCPVVRTSIREAELIKYASNALLGTLISFSNEIAALCEVLPDTSVDTVMRGLHLDRRLSPVVGGQRVSPGLLSYLWAGAGFGGSCLPKDIAALSHSARQLGVAPHLLDAVLAVNRGRPQRMIDLAERELGSLRGKTVAALGLAFKPGTDDVRDSPAVAAIREALQRGAKVVAFDPLAMSTARAVLGDAVAYAESAQATAEGADCAFVLTGCAEFAALDLAAFTARMKRPLLIDGRGVFVGRELPAGVSYLTIGKYYGGQRAHG